MAYERDQEVTPYAAGGGTSSSSSGASPASYPEGTSAEQIRRDIARTRAEMDATVDALEDRLRPRHLFDDLLDLFKGGGKSSSSSSSDSGSQAMDAARQVGSKVIDKLKQHPVPAALIGAGITWLMFEGDDGGRTRAGYTPRKWDVPEYSGSFVDARTGQPYDPATYGREYRGTAGTSGMAGQGAAMIGNAGTTGGESGGPGMVDKAKDALGSAADSVKGAASAVADTVSGWAGSARDSASGTGSAARGYASDANEQLRRGYEAGRHYVDRGIEEYPLAMGAAAMALGVLAGLCLPHTRAEDRLMGEPADAVKERAKEAGQDLVDRGKHVASAAASAAAGEARDSDLNPDSLVEKVKHVARDVTAAAAESARREGLDPSTLAQKGREVADRAKDAARDEVQGDASRAGDRSPA